MATFCPTMFYGSWNGLYYYHGVVCENCSMMSAADSRPHAVGGPCQACGGPPPAAGPPVQGCYDPIINPAPPEAGEARRGRMLFGRGPKKKGHGKVNDAAGLATDFTPGPGITRPQAADNFNVKYFDAKGDPREVRLMRVTALVGVVKDDGTGKLVLEADTQKEVKLLIGRERNGGAANVKDVELHDYDPVFSKYYHQVQVGSEVFHVILKDADHEP
jgi:hypothetical protein